MLQPEPRSGEGCNTFLPEGLENVNALGKECYIVIVIYLMTAVLIMRKYFSYLTACAVSRAVMDVEKILSHLPGGKESTFLTSRSVVKDDFPTF